MSTYITPKKTTNSNIYYCSDYVCKGEGWVWPLGIIMQALTSNNETEVSECLSQLTVTILYSLQLLFISLYSYSYSLLYINNELLYTNNELLYTNNELLYIYFYTCIHNINHL